MSYRDEQEQRLKEAEREMDIVAQHVPERERLKVERLREQHETGDDRGSYGHDLFQAIRRGWRNKAKASCVEAMKYQRNAGCHTDRSAFAMAFSTLVQAAAEAGVDEAGVRSSVERALAAEDATRLSRYWEQA